MNKLSIIGNLTRDPELRETNDGVAVCSFTVAVNRRVKEGQHPQADYVRVTAWRQLGEICAQYLAKGRKVYADGPVRAGAYMGKDGNPIGTLEMTAEHVEFLTPKKDVDMAQDPAGDGFTEVDDEEIPF